MRLNDISKVEPILEVLRDWSSPNLSFDSTWHGYNTLHDELLCRTGESIPIDQIKRILKELRNGGKVALLPCYKEDSNHLCGSGYFINPKFLKESK